MLCFGWALSVWNIQIHFWWKKNHIYLSMPSGDVEKLQRRSDIHVKQPPEPPEPLVECKPFFQAAPLFLSGDTTSRSSYLHYLLLVIMTPEMRLNLASRYVALKHQDEASQAFSSLAVKQKVKRAVTAINAAPVFCLWCCQSGHKVTQKFVSQRAKLLAKLMHRPSKLQKVLQTSGFSMRQLKQLRFILIHPNFKKVQCLKKE